LVKRKSKEWNDLTIGRIEGMYEVKSQERAEVGGKENVCGLLRV